MSGSGALRTLLLLAALAALAAAGCGSDSGSGEIPAEAATALDQSLQRVEDAQAAGDCFTAEDAAGDFRSRAEDLDGEVEDSISDSLREGADRVDTLVEQEICAREGTTDLETEATTTTEPTTTAPETTTTTTEETTTTTEPEEEEEDDGGGSGGGGGGGEPPAPPEEPPDGGGGGEEPSGGDGGVGADE